MPRTTIAAAARIQNAASRLMWNRRGRGGEAIERPRDALVLMPSRLARGSDDPVHLIRREDGGEPPPQGPPGLVAELAPVRVLRAVGETVRPREPRGPAPEERPDDGMGVRVVSGQDVLQGCFEQVPQGRCPGRSGPSRPGSHGRGRGPGGSRRGSAARSSTPAASRVPRGARRPGCGTSPRTPREGAGPPAVPRPHPRVARPRGRHRGFPVPSPRPSRSPRAARRRRSSGRGRR